MYKIVTIVFLLLGGFCFSQEYEITKEGLRDSKNLEIDYLIIEAKNNTAGELYLKAVRYVNERYTSPKEAIKSKLENQYLKYKTFVSDFAKVKNGGAKIPVDALYTIELQFKDGRVKFSLLDLDLGGITWAGSVWKGYPIYNKKGRLRLPETKAFIEDYFNTEVAELSDYLNDKAKKGDW